MAKGLFSIRGVLEDFIHHELCARQARQVVLSLHESRNPLSFPHSLFGKEILLSQRDNLGRPLPGADYVSLPRINKENQMSEDFRNALKEFFRKHPDLVSNPKMVDLLRYCYIHYVNFDPNFRDLSVSEKLEEANKMASNFWGSMSKA